MKHLLLLCAGLMTATGAWAGDAHKSDDPIAAQLFAPELVMAHQQQIGLADAQRKAIIAAITALQAKVVDIQWQMTSEQTTLAELLARPRVDEAAALASADKLMDLERRVKHEHLTALIRIKNLLRPEQQTRLRAFMAEQDSDH